MLADLCSEFGWCFHIDREEADDVIQTLCLDVIVIVAICLAVSYYRSYRKNHK
jgi:hypothetical protein